MRISGAGVYVVAAVDLPGVYKIGVTTSIADRLRDLQSASPSALKVVLWRSGATRTFEQALHRTFDGERLHGEWFRLGEPEFAALERAFSAQVSVDSVRVGAPPRRSTSRGPSRTLGRCELCGKNVQTRDKHVSRPGRGKGRKARRPVFRHVDCSDLRRAS